MLNGTRVQPHGLATNAPIRHRLIAHDQLPMDPVILFFLLGLFARIVKSDLRLPDSLYETLSIFLLLAIGIKGGIELSQQPWLTLLPQALAVIGLSLMIPVLLYPVLRRLVQLNQPDAASIAAHFGSVSVVTFAVAQSTMARLAISTEAYLPLFVALMEAPGIIAGIVLARMGSNASSSGTDPKGGWQQLAHEVFFGKSVLLLMGGLVIGAVAGPDGIKPIAPVYLDLFKGVLGLFLLEMGLVAGGRLGDLKRAGWRLLAFGILAPIALGGLGVVAGQLMGLSTGGSAVLGALCASASYIAAPTAMRIAVPQANPALSIGVALGITFPFNIVLGIPLYLKFAHFLANLAG